MKKQGALEREFRPLTDAESAYVKNLENPYASLSIGLDTKPEKVAAVSARGFEAECIRIFRQYIPSAERGRLRVHYREFIERNRVRSPSARLRILEHLRVYDLSTTPGLQPQFNRERTEITSDKLLKIEQIVSREMGNT